MEISKYGVTLKRLTPDKIELVRNWRNDPKISQYMEFKDYITPEMQEKWFSKIDNECNYYFIIVYQGKEVGLTNVKDINYDKMEGEGGIFIYADEFLNSDVAYRATMCQLDYFFETLNFNQIVGRVLRNNKRAIRYNNSLGGEPLPNQEHLENQLWRTPKDKYLICRTKLLQLLKL